MINFSNIDKKLLTIIIISILATFNAAYLTYSAYTIETVAQFSFGGGLIEGTGSACDINSTFSCSTVFDNSFAWLFGIPFSLIALIVYPIIVGIAVLGLLDKIKNHYKIILAMAIGGLIFNGYIIINEYLIGTYCLLCLICTLIIIINGGLSIKGLKTKKLAN